MENYKLETDFIKKVISFEDLAFRYRLPEMLLLRGRLSGRLTLVGVPDIYNRKQEFMESEAASKLADKFKSRKLFRKDIHEIEEDTFLSFFNSLK